MDTHQLEQSPEWAAILTALEDQNIGEVAGAFGVTPGSLAEALLRVDHVREPVPGPGAPSPERATVNADGGSGSGFIRPGTSDEAVAPFLSRLGTEPDRVIAEEAGVSVRTVAEFRRSRGIAGRRGRGPGKRTSSARNTKSRSTISKFEERLGLVPDAEIAKAAGVSIPAVSTYRRRRGIPSYRSQRTRARVAQFSGSKSVEPQADTSGITVYRVRMADESPAFLIAGSLSEAARTAEALGALGVEVAGPLVSHPQ